MKAITKQRADTRGISIQDVPEPILKPNRVMIRVRAAGICGSDVSIYKGEYQQLPVPLILGHEWAGEVIGVGSDVRDFQINDRVTAELVIPCEKCFCCLTGKKNLCLESRAVGISTNGAFAERISLPAGTHIHKIPQEMTFEEGACVEPASVAMHGVERTMVGPGDKLLVIGPGPIGLYAVQAGRLCGAKVIVSGTREGRLKVARQLGACETINIRTEDVIERIQDLTGGLGVDIVLEASGRLSGLEQALKSVRSGGEICIIGLYHEPIHLDPQVVNRVVRKEITIKGSYTYTWKTFERVISLIAAGKIKTSTLITHRVPIIRAKEGFEAVIRRDALKVIINV